MSRRLAAEFLGTALLLAAVVGSGIMGQRLSAGNAALTLLANSIATGTMLVALILAFGPISGAHFNPLVTAATGTPWREASLYVVAQCAGAILGVVAANLMFGLPACSAAQRVRTGPAQWVSEGVAAFGLVGVILSVSRSRPDAMPLAVGAYITAAYWFTASTSFANPAVTLARAFSDTFTGIRLADVPGFVASQIAGAAVAVVLFKWLLGPKPSSRLQGVDAPP